MNDQKPSTNLAPDKIPISPVKSLFYWKKHWWAPQPVILALTQDRSLTMKNKSQIVFQTTIDKVSSVEFTSWGTMKLTIDGKKYAIVGTPTQYSMRPSKEQLAEMQGGVTSVEVGAGLDQIVGTIGATIPSPVLTPIGLAADVMAEVAYFRGLNRLRDWQSVFVTSGVNVKESTMKSVKYLWIIGGPIVLIAMVLVIILFGGKK